MNAWRRAAAFIRSTTGRLALSYLAIIMLMSISFSAVFFSASSHELGRQVPPMVYLQRRSAGDPYALGEINRFFRNRIDEGRNALLWRLAGLNAAALAGGGLLSYYLARRTLRPIEESMEAQYRFISDASHELRTPLAALQSSNEVALRRANLNLDDAKELLRSNIDEVIKLKTLANDLLALAKQDQQKTTSIPVSMQDVAAEAMNNVIAPAQAKHITLHDTTPPIKVLADPQSLAQVLVILLDNAIKFSHDKGAIYIAGHKKGKYGLLSVRDEGVGIRATDLPHLFQRFYQADASRTKHATAGYGLGLSIAQQIIHRYGGDITAISTPGKGATFTVKLPLA